jgi:hypothetical protein
MNDARPVGRQATVLALGIPSLVAHRWLPLGESYAVYRGETRTVRLSHGAEPNGTEP